MILYICDMTNNKPIGLFDSGIGGTSIWKAIHELLPSENTIYIADSKNAPYGVRSKEEIIDLSKKNTELLIDMGAKMIVVACNTATTNAIRELREAYDIPFVGIEPAIRPAAKNSVNHTIGVLATKGTLSSELFNDAVERLEDTTVVEQVGYGLVELIETGRLHSEEMTKKLQQYLQPMIAAKVDYLVLGCSHYPYLIPQIRKILPEDIMIIDSGEAVARQTRHILEQTGFNTGDVKAPEFYTNSDPTVLNNILENKYEVKYRDF
jgi:glutamate racemase